MQPSDRQARSKLRPGLHLVATPIGNLGDLSPRALAVLTDADLVVCEDTRTTGRLLRHLGIDRALRSYHEHNAEAVRPDLVRRLRQGDAVALVSDAGTPLISDPGYKLVRAAIDAEIEVLAVPGASAALAALSVAGLPTDRFFVAGFLPNRTTARRKSIETLRPVPGTLVLFESARRLAATLADLASILGVREAAVARELTKRFEEVRRGDLASLRDHYAASGPPKGEITVVVGPPAPEGPATSPEEVDRMLADALASMSVREAVAAVAGATGQPRREVYRRALDLNRS